MRVRSERSTPVVPVVIPAMIAAGLSAWTILTCLVVAALHVGGARIVEPVRAVAALVVVPLLFALVAGTASKTIHAVRTA